MITILIVDDEKLERSGIKFLLKRESEELEILEAENGKAALGILQSKRVDILFSDIKMPYMNGLELAGKARELSPEMEIVIFSGYNDFTYARDAMRYGVVDYVLKPVNPDEFHKTYSRVIGKLKERSEQEQRRLAEENDLKKYLLLNYLYSGSEEEKHKLEQISTEAWDGYTRMILSGSSDNFFESEEEPIVFGLKEKIGRGFFYLNLNSNESLFLFSEKYSDYEHLANQMYQFFHQHFDAECYFVVSEPITGLVKMPKQFQKMEELLEEQFYQPKQHVFLVGHKPEEVSAEAVRDAEVLESISADIKYQDMARLWQDFHLLEQRYCTEKQFSEMYVKFVFSGIVKEIYQAMPSVGEKELSRTVDRLYRCKTIREVLDITEKCIKELEEGQEEKDEGFRREIAQVKSYICHNYQQNLSVEMLAERVYLSAGYLSAVFKEETGMNLNRFIREVRMNKAKEMLADTNMKITQIAKAVGFSNTSYFCRSFREFFGNSPESCRRGDMNDQEAASEL
nr:response regulator [uncultured Faecalicatena sp.]